MVECYISSVYIRFLYFASPNEGCTKQNKKELTESQVEFFLSYRHKKSSAKHENRNTIRINNNKFHASEMQRVLFSQA